MATQNEKIEMMLKFMEYDALSDAQHELIISYESFYERAGYLTHRQYEVLQDIFKKASEK